jgi:hypothetical protein
VRQHLGSLRRSYVGRKQKQDNYEHAKC